VAEAAAFEHHNVIRLSDGKPGASDGGCTVEEGQRPPELLTTDDDRVLAHEGNLCGSPGGVTLGDDDIVQVGAHRCVHVTIKCPSESRDRDLEPPRCSPTSKAEWVG
jgi:hypothetical protein